MDNKQIEYGLESLIESFKKRQSKSDDRSNLLKIEIESHELLFDDKRLPLSSNVFSNNRPLKYLNYTDLDIVSIREAYHRYIVNGADIEQSGQLYKDTNGMFIRRTPEARPIHYYIEAKTRYLYLLWLRELINIDSGRLKKYPDKYYAWYHKILIALGKEHQFTPGAKQEIVNYGKSKYGTKGGFYQAYMEFDLTKRKEFVKGMTDRERKKWKKMIIEISNNDSDVISYLGNYPN